MDENKLKKLREIHYKIPKICQFCKHSQWESNHGYWGVCERTNYDHKKHTISNREVSILRFGGCVLHEQGKDTLWLHGFKEFLEK